MSNIRLCVKCRQSVMRARVCAACFALASSQAAQHRTANSLLPCNLSARLIGQSWFHSTSFPLYLYILCWLNGEWRIRGLKKQTNKKTPLVRKCYLKTFSCSHKQIVTRHPLYVLETRRSPEIEQCKCAGPDRAHLVHWVHLNFRIVRDRLIISNTFFFFGFFFFSSTRVTFSLCELN